MKPEEMQYIRKHLKLLHDELDEMVNIEDFIEELSNSIASKINNLYDKLYDLERFIKDQS